MRKLAVAIATCAILTPAAVLALGLGDIHLGSKLNQPLNANIDLVSLRGIPADDIKVSLASNNEFDKAGIERSYALNDLKFSVEGEGDNAVVRVRTKDAIREPFLSFILEVNWPSGRLLREYTVLLDPPAFGEEPVIAAPSPKTSTKVSVTTTAGTVSTPVKTESLPSMAGTDSYGPTVATDTLWSIATRVRPEGASVHQTLAALFKANPQAFSNNDPNQMLQGQTLKVPAAADIVAMPKRKALAEIAGGTSAVVETRSARAGSGAAGSSGRVVLAAPPEKFAEPSSKPTAATAQAREAAELLRQENSQLRGDVDKLAQKTQQLEKLLLLKEQQLAAIQGKVATPAAPAPAQTTAAPAPAVEPALTAPAATETPATETASSESAGAEVAPETPAPAETAAAEPARMPEQEAAPDAEEGSWFMANWTWLAGFGAISALVGFMIRHRNKVAEEKFHDTLLPRDGHSMHAESPSVEFGEDLDLPEVGEDILAPAETSSYSEGAVQSVDPLGEADVYIAYNKFEQAETLLLQAIAAQPERKELRLKLLECYAEMRDSDKFRAMVAQMGDALSRDNQMAQAVADLQARAWPQDDLIGNELPTADDIFGGAGKPSGSAIESQSVAEVSLGGGEPSTSAAWRPTRKADVVAADSDEFNLDAHADFGGFGAGEEPTPTSPGYGAVAETAPAAGSEFGFSLPAEEVPAAAPMWGREPTPASDEFALDDGEMSLPTGDELGMTDIDEIATKLDLARAYIEMHEVDGAREILQEVLAEGNSQQKQEAEALLARI